MVGADLETAPGVQRQGRLTCTAWAAEDPNDALETGQRERMHDWREVLTWVWLVSAFRAGGFEEGWLSMAFGFFYGLSTDLSVLQTSSCIQPRHLTFRVPGSQVVVMASDATQQTPEPHRKHRDERCGVTYLEFDICVP